MGDVNGDGKTDLALNECDLVYGCTVYILLGNGDGTFQAPAEVVPGTPPLEGTGALAGADFNGDGKMDLIWGQLDLVLENPNLAKIYLSNGDGTFSNTSSYALNPLSTPNSTGVAVADFNGDGKPDVAIGNTVLLGNGDGTFGGEFCGLAFRFSPGFLLFSNRERRTSRKV